MFQSGETRMTNVVFSSVAERETNLDLGHYEIRMLNGENEDLMGIATFDYNHNEKKLVLKHAYILNKYKKEELPPTKSLLRKLIKISLKEGLKGIDFTQFVRYPTLPSSVSLDKILTGEEK